MRGVVWFGIMERMGDRKFTKGVHMSEVEGLGVGGRPLGEHSGGIHE